MSGHPNGPLHWIPFGSVACICGYDYALAQRVRAREQPADLFGDDDGPVEMVRFVEAPDDETPW